MRRLLLIVVIVLGVCGLAFGQESGIPDTLKLEGDTLILGQSVPILLTVVNDYTLQSFSMGLIGVNGAAGYAKFDSVTFINRMEDPRQLGFRVVRFRSDDGMFPDTLILFATSGTSTEEIWLQPGNNPIAEIWMTGTQLGEMQVDSTFYPPGGTFGFEERLGDFYIPVFSAHSLVVIEGTEPPVLEIPDDDIRIAAGTPVSAIMPASSPEGFPFTVTILDFSDVYGSLTPSSQPVITSGNPSQFSWTPTSSDIGIWRVSLKICDSALVCNEYQFNVQVVENDSYLISFDIQTLPDAPLANSIDIGNLDEDANPEIIISGDAILNTNPLTIYNLDNNGNLQEDDYSVISEVQIKAGRLAYLDSDGNLDLVAGRGGPSSFHAMVTFLGDGDLNLIEQVENSAPTTNFSSGIAAEFTGDQCIDYAGTGREGTIIYSGDCSGNVTFTNYVATDTSHAIDAADFDNDGDIDLAVGTNSGLKVYLNDGFGNMTLTNTYSQNFGSTDLDITNQGADFNNDGFYDICLAAPSIGTNNSELVLYLGNGDGSFNSSVLTAPSGILYGNCIADFNYDGVLDLALINNSESYLAILFGDGDGTFSNELRFKVPQYNPTAFGSSDFDLDGDIDLFIIALAQDIQRKAYYFKNQLNPQNLNKTTVSFEAIDNAALELVSSTGRTLSSIKNTISSGEYRNRDLNGNTIIDDYMTLAIVEDGPYVLNVFPKANVARATNFSLKFEIDGELFAMAENQVMSSIGYQFEIHPTGVSPVSPAPGRTTFRNPTTLSWEGSGSYNLQLARDIQFNDLVSETVVNGTSYVTPTLDTSSTSNIYYWRVKPTGQSEYEVVYPFKVSLYSCALRGDVNHDGKRNIIDLTYMVDFMFRGGLEPLNPEEGDVDSNGTMDITDLTALVSYLFKGGATPSPCL